MIEHESGPEGVLAYFAGFVVASWVYASQQPQEGNAGFVTFFGTWALVVLVLIAAGAVVSDLRARRGSVGPRPSRAARRFRRR